MPELKEWPREQIVEGLKSGHTLIVQRKDDPNLPFLQQLQADGKVEMKVEQLDEQSSQIRVTWVDENTLDQ